MLKETDLVGFVIDVSGLPEKDWPSLMHTEIFNGNVKEALKILLWRDQKLNPSVWEDYCQAVQPGNTLEGSNLNDYTVNFA